MACGLKCLDRPDFETGRVRDWAGSSSRLEERRRPESQDLCLQLRRRAGFVTDIWLSNLISTRNLGPLQRQRLLAPMRRASST